MNMKINKALTFGVGLMLAGSISVNAQKVSFNGEQGNHSIFRLDTHVP